MRTHFMSTYANGWPAALFYERVPAFAFWAAAQPFERGISAAATFKGYFLF
jgi:hypothetical protein